MDALVLPHEMDDGHTLTRFLRHPAVVIAWLLLLSAYTLAGVGLTPFHGDEAMQIYMSRDYVTAFVERAPERLLANPPYPIDSDQQLRILNGTINRYAIGLSWYLAGLTPDDLPPAPGWDWGLTYERGVETGHRPPDALLNVARLPSALLLCASIGVMFALGWQFGGARLAYLASLLYALNPVILLNGRRAMQEGALLCFGLLAILAAAIMSRKRAAGEKVSWGWWALLTLAGALTLASKHSGIVFVASAFAWLLAAELMANRRTLSTTLARLVAAGVGTLLLFVALSPALWNDPPARLRDMLAAREELLAIQVAVDPNAPTTLPQRIGDIVTQPFIAPLMVYEARTFADSAAFRATIGDYTASPLSGAQFGLAGGAALTILAGVGVVIAAKRGGALHVGLLVWLVLTVVTLLANPLPWQRYFLPLIPAATLLSGIGLGWAAALCLRIRTQPDAGTLAR